jgi:hypothetical protein
MYLVIKSQRRKAEVKGLRKTVELDWPVTCAERTIGKDTCLSGKHNFLGASIFQSSVESLVEDQGANSEGWIDCESGSA